MLTFNQTLRGYVSELAKEQVWPRRRSISPSTPSATGRCILSVSETWSTDGRGETASKRYFSRVGLVGSNLEYFTDEVEYAMGRFPPDQRKGVLRATRSGRGRAPAVPQRIRQRLLTNVIETFEAQKADCGESDWGDIAVEAQPHMVMATMSLWSPRPKTYRPIRSEPSLRI